MSLPAKDALALLKNTIDQLDFWSVDKVFDKINEPWKPLILYFLSEGIAQHREVRNLMTECNRIFFGQEIEALEKLGLIYRELRGAAPPTAYYYLTPMGQKLRPIYEPYWSWVMAKRQAEQG